MYQVLSYIKFLLKSTNQHGVHSPFVYDLLTKCLYKKEQFSELKTLLAYRKALLKDPNTIKVRDFGSGSRIFNSNERAVAKIAKVAGITHKRQKLLFKIVRYFQAKDVPATYTILELGTSLGMATAAMSLGNPSATINTVEGCPETSAKAGALFSSFGLHNITTHNMSFEAYFRSITNTDYKESKKQIDFAFIDGNHTERDTINYFTTLLPFCHNNTVLIFDDIYWSKSMTSAWNTIKDHKKVRVSIDSYKWGIVFFRTEQEKQHFTLRL